MHGEHRFKRLALSWLAVLKDRRKLEKRAGSFRERRVARTAVEQEEGEEEGGCISVESRLPAKQTNLNRDLRRSGIKLLEVSAINENDLSRRVVSSRIVQKKNIVQKNPSIGFQHIQIGYDFFFSIKNPSISFQHIQIEYFIIIIIIFKCYLFEF